MKQISTGAGLVALAVGMVATAFIATHRGSGEAFAQVTGGERRIVSASLFTVQNQYPSSTGEKGSLWSYRIWSDNAVDVRCIGYLESGSNYGETQANVRPLTRGDGMNWQTLDNGTSGFRPLTDVDMSGEIDAGDISQVLLDFNTRSDDLPPPPIDCTINAPR
jgi:hypothetical protein